MFDSLPACRAYFHVLIFFSNATYYSCNINYKYRTEIYLMYVCTCTWYMFIIYMVYFIDFKSSVLLLKYCTNIMFLKVYICCCTKCKHFSFKTFEGKETTKYLFWMLMPIKSSNSAQLWYGKGVKIVPKRF